MPPAQATCVVADGKETVLGVVPVARGAELAEVELLGEAYAGRILRKSREPRKPTAIARESLQVKDEHPRSLVDCELLASAPSALLALLAQP